MDRRLIELCDAIADRGHGAESSAAVRSRGGSRPAPCRSASPGFAATTITTLEDGALVPTAYHRLDDVPSAIDADALEAPTASR